MLMFQIYINCIVAQFLNIVFLILCCRSQTNYMTSLTLPSPPSPPPHTPIHFPPKNHHLLGSIVGSPQPALCHSRVASMSRLPGNIIFQLTFGKCKLFAGLCQQIYMFLILIEIDWCWNFSWISLGRENKEYLLAH